MIAYLPRGVAWHTLGPGPRTACGLPANNMVTRDEPPAGMKRCERCRVPEVNAAARQRQADDTLDAIAAAQAADVLLGAPRDPGAEPVTRRPAEHITEAERLLAVASTDGQMDGRTDVLLAALTHTLLAVAKTQREARYARP